MMQAAPALHINRITDSIHNMRLQAHAMNHSYDAVFLYFENEQEMLSVAYPVHIKFQEDHKTSRPSLLIKQGNVLIGSEEPQLLSEQFAAFTGKAFFPVEMFFAPGGSFGSLYNYEQLKKNWAAVKEHALLQFEGEAAAIALQQVENLFSRADTLEKCFAAHPFFAFFFSVIYWNRKIESAPGIKLLLPIVPHSPAVSFEGKRSFSFADEAKMNISIIAACSDERSFEKIFYAKTALPDKAELPVQGSLELEYEVYEKTGILSSVTGWVSLQNEDGNERKTFVSIKHNTSSRPLEADFEPDVKEFYSGSGKK